MLEFDFMRRTLMVGFLLSIMIPLIGIIMVNRRTSMMGDALAHTSLAGVGLGLILGIDPSIGAVFVTIISAFAIEGIRHRFPQYGDMATAIIMSIGLGLASILSDFAPGGNTFESYLFGSISATSVNDLLMVTIVFILVAAMSISNYAGLLYIGIDPNLARLSGVPVAWINSIFTLLTALTVGLSTKIVGALLVSSMIVLPVATALILARSYRQVYIYSILNGIIYMMVGLILSYYLDIKPGGAIVLLAVLGMGIAYLVQRMRKRKLAT